MRWAGLTVLVIAIGLVGCGDGNEGATTGGTTEAATGTTESAGEETVPEKPPSADEPEQTGNGEVLPATAQNAPEDALVDALASGDPDLACERSVTDAYVREAYGSAQGCRSAQSGNGLADHVRAEEVTLTDSRGKGVVRFEGGTYDGEEGKVRLVLEDDRWKLDSLEVDVPPGP